MRQLISSNGKDLVAFAITGILVLIISLIYVWWVERTSGRLSCPGLQPDDINLGNLVEVSKKGGLHQFLSDHHKKLGPIFSFFWGKVETVSIASPALFRDASLAMLFDRSVEQFEIFKPLSGEYQYNVLSLNSPVGPKHKKIHDRQYSFAAIDNYFSEFVDIGNELINKWRKINIGEHIPLTQHMLVIAMKSVMRASFGKEYFRNNKEIIEFQEAYHTCWEDMEERLYGNVPDDGSERQKIFDEHLNLMRNRIKEIIKNHQSKKNKGNPQNLLEALLQDESYVEDDHIIDTFITYLVGGFHTTGYLLGWAIYFLCLNPEVEEKLYKEIIDVIGDAEITLNHCKQLKYMEMVINETLRCSTLVPFASQCSLYDVRIGGHIIPKDTPIITALGVVSQDSSVWSEPSKFDPDRFNSVNMQTYDPLAFQPFGFAGKRKCPGFRFAFYEAFVYLTCVVRNFNIRLVDEQNVSYYHRLVTQFDDELWITADPRE